MIDNAKTAYLGRRAKELLEDDLLMACFEACRQDYIDAWSQAQTPEARESCWQAQKGLEAVKQKLMTTIANGKIAARALDNN